MDIVELIRGIGIEGARFIEEHVDPQFQALLHLYEHMGNKERFAPLVIANALVSYQLSGRGEDWWWEFARYFSENPVVDFAGAYKVFLPQSRTNRRLVDVKVRRLRRAEAFLQNMRPEEYYGNMIALQTDLARILGTKKNAKTIVFAVKMFGYAMRIATGEFRPYPMEVPIPVDSRIRKLTERLDKDNPARFWQDVAEQTRVPPLHIDSILWPALSGDPDVQDKIRRTFGNIGDELILFLSP